MDSRTCAREGCNNPLPSWSRANRRYCDDPTCAKLRSRESSRQSRRDHQPRRLRKRRSIDEQLGLDPGGDGEPGGAERIGITAKGHRDLEWVPASPNLLKGETFCAICGKDINILIRGTTERTTVVVRVPAVLHNGLWRCARCLRLEELVTALDTTARPTFYATLGSLTEAEHDAVLLACAGEEGEHPDRRGARQKLIAALSG